MVSLRRWPNGDGLGEGGDSKVLKVSKVSQISGITSTITSLDTYAGSVKSVKSVQMMSLRRWLNGDGWMGVGVWVKSVKSATNIQNFLYIASFDTYKGSVKSVHMMSSRR